MECCLPKFLSVSNGTGIHSPTLPWPTLYVHSRWTKKKKHLFVMKPRLAARVFIFALCMRKFPRNLKKWWGFLRLPVNAMSKPAFHSRKVCTIMLDGRCNCLNRDLPGSGWPWPSCCQFAVLCLCNEDCTTMCKLIFFFCNPKAQWSLPRVANMVTCGDLVERLRYLKKKMSLIL